MISLFDYLGKAAGKELGEKVNKYAKIRKVKVGARYVETPVYKGFVMLYTPEFLDEFFEAQKIFN
jgi:hypothetical protein